MFGCCCCCWFSIVCLKLWSDSGRGSTSNCWLWHSKLGPDGWWKSNGCYLWVNQSNQEREKSVSFARKLHFLSKTDIRSTSEVHLAQQMCFLMSILVKNIKIRIKQRTDKIISLRLALGKFLNGKVYKNSMKFSRFAKVFSKISCHWRFFGNVKWNVGFAVSSITIGSRVDGKCSKGQL